MFASLTAASGQRTGLAVVWSMAVSGCAGSQSALDPAGRAADRIEALFWWMCAGASIVWLAVVGLAIWATKAPPREHSSRGARTLVVGGGVVAPVIVLGGLLGYGLALLPDLLAPAATGGPRIVVTAEQYWWRVRYESATGEHVDVANEIRLPVGRASEIGLESHDVIHSLWIPSLGGKVDAIPGRHNRIVLEPTRTGTFTGLCAEYCGTSHAWMQLSVVVVEDDEYATWLASQAQPAALPDDPIASRGAELFVADGCGACHAVRGTRADGVVGPDLTHVASRLSIGAGRTSRGPEALELWIHDPAELKPGVQMPAFHMLPSADITAIAAYLESLR